MSNALITAVYNSLSGGSYNVYDHVPQNTVYPYITLGPHEALPEDHTNSRFERQLLYVTAWSDYRGQKEVQEMLDWVVGQLHRTRLLLSTGKKAAVTVDRRRVTLDIDGQTYMGSATIVALFQP